jgi:hypothetical protein
MSNLNVLLSRKVVVWYGCPIGFAGHFCQQPIGGIEVITPDASTNAGLLIAGATPEHPPQQ